MIDDYKDGRNYNIFFSDINEGIFRKCLIDAFGEVANPIRAIAYFLEDNAKYLNAENLITYDEIERIRKFEIDVEKEITSRINFWENNPPRTADEIYNCAYDFNFFRDNPSSNFANKYLIDRMFQYPEDYVDSLNEIKNNPNKMNCLKVALDEYIQDNSENMRLMDGDRIYINNGPKIHYVRGENNVYSKSVPSMFRDEERTEIDYIIDELKINEFSRELSKIPSIKQWCKNISDINVDAIAQHYGMRTRFLDFTTNIKVALFFASTIWDNKEQRFRPFTKDETCEGTDKQRYGTIYLIPASLVRTVSDIYNYPYIIKIGKQPFLRPYYQSGYLMELGKDDDLNKIPFKIKFKIRLTEELSKRIFEEMNCGNNIYPNEPFEEIATLANKINMSYSINEESIDEFLKRNNCQLNKKVLLEKLKIKGYEIRSTNYLGDDEIKILEKKLKESYDDFPKELKEINVKEKFKFCL